MTTKKTIRVGLVVPHIFMHRDILPRVIFSPGSLALELSEGLRELGAHVTLFTPGPVDTSVHNMTADLSYFEQELVGRGDTYLDLLKKHPFTFVTLARQVQSEIIAIAYEMANRDELDIVHIYANEEDIALPFAKLCKKPVIFTHHDPFNFLVKYKSVFPKYKDLNWLSMSYAQRASMPDDTNWAANIYHGLDMSEYRPLDNPTSDYIAYLGRIIEPKGVHLAIKAVKSFNQTAEKPIKLKIAGKHYGGHTKDTYWTAQIEPELDESIEYVGFIDSTAAKREFLGNAKALMIPSTFEEPFGMVMIESLACGTPLIGLDSGAIPEVITNNNGILVAKTTSVDETGKIVINGTETANALRSAIQHVDRIDRKQARDDFEARFTSDRMYAEHLAIYDRLTQ